MPLGPVKTEFRPTLVRSRDGHRVDVPGTRTAASLSDVGIRLYTGAMASKLADYIEAGKALGADERLEAAHQLLLSVDRDEDANQDEIDASWDEVIRRRVNEVLDGSANLVDGPTSHAQVRAEIAARHR